MKIILQDGRILQGSKRDMVEQMQSLSFTPHTSLEEYVGWCAKQIGVKLIEQTPEALIDVMLDSQFAVEKQEPGK